MREKFTEGNHHKRKVGSGEGRRPYTRTDLACESRVPASEVQEETVSVGASPVRLIRRREVDGGHSVTLAFGSIIGRGEEDIPGLADLLSRELTVMATAMLGRKPDGASRILVVGLGNAHMTPDAIGPEAVRRLTVTRHVKVFDPALFASMGCCELAAFSPGVLGETGMESGELVQCVAELARPDLVVAVDAMAARSCERLSSTVQLSDGGISPGAGIGNRRTALNRQTLGCPVMGVGVPTVVDSATLVWDALEQAGLTERDMPEALTEVLERGRSFIVSPKDCDETVELTARLLARALDEAFGIGR